MAFNFPIDFNQLMTQGFGLREGLAKYYHTIANNGQTLDKYFETLDDRSDFGEMLDLMLVRDDAGYCSQGEFLAFHVNHTSPPFTYNSLGPHGIDLLKSVVHVAGTNHVKVVGLVNNPQYNNLNGRNLGMLPTGRFDVQVVVHGQPKGLRVPASNLIAI